MVTASTVALAAGAVLSGAALSVLLWRLRGEARHLDGPGMRRLTLALGLLAPYIVVRFLQAVGIGTIGPVFFVRNAFWAAAWGLALSVVLTFPGATAAHRTAAWILPVAAAPAALLLPFGVNVVAHYVGLGALGGILAVLAWRLDRPAAPGVRGLATAGAVLAVALAWIDALILSGAARGDGDLFFAARLLNDASFVILALFALPALRERPLAAAPAVVAPQATGP